MDGLIQVLLIFSKTKTLNYFNALRAICLFVF